MLTGSMQAASIFLSLIFLSPILFFGSFGIIVVQQLQWCLFQLDSSVKVVFKSFHPLGCFYPLEFFPWEFHFRGKNSGFKLFCPLRCFYPLEFFCPFIFLSSLFFLLCGFVLFVVRLQSLFLPLTHSPARPLTSSCPASAARRIRFRMIAG